jgi:hypothetical protein
MVAHVVPNINSDRDTGKSSEQKGGGNLKRNLNIIVLTGLKEWEMFLKINVKVHQKRVRQIVPKYLIQFTINVLITSTNKTDHYMILEKYVNKLTYHNWTFIIVYSNVS